MIDNKESTISLLEQLTKKMNYNYLSDFKFLNDMQRKQLSHEIEQIPPETFSLRDWNDALTYLIKSPSEADAGTAKKQLVLGLQKIE